MLVWEEDRYPVPNLAPGALERAIDSLFGSLFEPVYEEVQPPAHAGLMIDCPPRELAVLHARAAAAQALRARARYRHPPKGRFQVPNRERSQAPPQHTH